jgi:hypothetical protein
MGLPRIELCMLMLCGPISRRLEQCTDLLRSMNCVTGLLPQCTTAHMVRYYESLAQLCKETDITLGDEVQQAILCPLSVQEGM